MIAALLLLAAQGPGIRHEVVPPGAPPVLQFYDRRGRTVRRLRCGYRSWLRGNDAVPEFARNRAFMAIVLERDGRIEPWDLEPAWATCDFLPLTEPAPAAPPPPAPPSGQR